MYINLKEISIMAMENMRHDKELVAGVKFAMDNLPKTFEGTYIECAQYINGKINTASINAIDNPMYIGCIALYGAMNDIILHYARK